jgi:DNA-binding MarR family transcriptional regulator
MFTKAGLKLLDALVARPDSTPGELGERTGYSREHVYRVLDTLLEAGLIEESRERHNQRQVRASDVPVVEAYRRLVGQLGHVQWSELLSPATLRVCWYLDTPRRVTTIADRLGISRQAVHTALSPLKGRAMLSPAGPEYALADDVEPLLAFAREAVTHDHRRRVRTDAPSATVEWCDPKRALVRVQRPEETAALQATDDWQPTGLAGFREFGLTFFLAGEPAFWHDPLGDLSPADLVCHTLVLDADLRRVSYAMLLIEAASIDRETLTRAASWYGLESAVARMYDALDDDFEPNEDVRLPSESEYAALKAQYGVP